MDIFGYPGEHVVTCGYTELFGVFDVNCGYPGLSVVIRRHLWLSVVIRSYLWLSVVIRSSLWLSVVIRSHLW